MQINSLLKKALFSLFGQSSHSAFVGAAELNKRLSAAIMKKKGHFTLELSVGAFSPGLVSHLCASNFFCLTLLM